MKAKRKLETVRRKGIVEKEQLLCETNLLISKTKVLDKKKKLLWKAL